MKKKFTLLLVQILLLSVASCSDDDSESVSLPSGIIVLTESVNTVAGDTFEIYFRTNPSDFTLHPERLQLDCLSLVPHTRSEGGGMSPDELTDLFELLSVEKVPDANPGSWMASVRVKESENPYEGVADLYLLLAGADHNGAPTITSLGKTSVSIIPPVSEKVLTLRTPYLQSYKIYHPEEKYLPARISFKPVDGDSFRYDLGWIKQASVAPVTHSGDFEITRTKDEDEIGFRIVPINDIFADTDERMIPVDFRITLTDKTGKIHTETRTIRFYDSMYTIAATPEFTHTHKQLADASNWIEYKVDMSEILPQLGLVPAIYEAHPKLAVTLANGSFDETFDPDNHPFLGFEVMDIEFADESKMTAEEFKAVPLLNMMNNEHPAGSYYAVLYITMTDPMLDMSSPMLCIEVRQEVKIVD